MHFFTELLILINSIHCFNYCQTCNVEFDAFKFTSKALPLNDKRENFKTYNEKKMEERTYIGISKIKKVYFILNIKQYFTS